MREMPGRWLLLGLAALGVGGSSTPLHVPEVRITHEVVKETFSFTPQSRRFSKRNLRPVVVESGTWGERLVLTTRTFFDNREVHREVTLQPLRTYIGMRLHLLHPEGRTVLKTYPLSRAKKRRMLATTYYIGDPLVPGDHTFLGYRLVRGLAAVDPSVIPLKTRLYVPGYGYAFAADTGSAIKGPRIDLAVDGREEAAAWGHRWVDVYILEQAKEW